MTLMLVAGTATGTTACSFTPGAAPGETGTSDGGAAGDGGGSNSSDGAVSADAALPINGHVRPLDIVDARVTGGPHVDFPVLVQLSATWLRDTASGGDVARADGFDIYFAADPAGQVRLAHEVEAYAPTTGDLRAWVKVPSLAASTVIYLHYGDTTITTSQQSVAAVWSGGYELVLHLTSAVDATGKTTNPTGSTAGQGAGQIGEATQFDGSASRIDYGSVAAIDNVFAGGGTAEGWFFAESYGENGFGRLFDKGHVDGWSLAVNDGNATKTLAFVHGAAGGNFGEWNGPSNAVTQNAWHHAAVVFDSNSAANDPTLYIDGVALAGIDELVAPSGTMDSDASFALSVGNRQALDRTFDGILDELRLSSVSRSGAWLATQYQNHADPVGFLSVGAAL